MTVMLIKACTCSDDSLADQIMAICKAPDDTATLKFIHNLCVAGWIVSVHKIIRRHSTHRLSDTIPVTIVHIPNHAAIQRCEAVVEVVGVGVTVGVVRISVVIVTVARQPIVRIVG